MTYKQAIKIQIVALEDIYKKASELREISMEDEKYPLNYMIGQIPKITGNLKTLLDTPDSVDRQVTGNYSINVKLEDVL